jgi:hypothetical protein
VPVGAGPGPQPRPVRGRVESANAVIEAGIADVVSFATHFTQRRALAVADRGTYYAGGAAGYR